MMLATCHVPDVSVRSMMSLFHDVSVCSMMFLFRDVSVPQCPCCMMLLFYVCRYHHTGPIYSFYALREALAVLSEEVRGVRLVQVELD